MLVAPGTASLKEKRSILRRIKDRTASKFKVTLAEVDYQDVHQQAVLGFAVAASSAEHAEARMENILRFVVGLDIAQVIADDREVVRFEDVDFGYAAALGEKFR